MGLFQEIEGEAAVIVEGGVYKQVPVYKRNGYLYAKVGGGFIRLYADGSTTKPKARLETLTWENYDTLGKDAIGKLCLIKDVPEAHPLTNDYRTKLLG